MHKPETGDVGKGLIFRPEIRKLLGMSSLRLIKEYLAVEIPPGENILDNPYLQRCMQLNSERKEWFQISDAREAMVKDYAWAIPNDAAIKLLVEYSPIVELGAGSGYWAHLVSKNGGDIVAYDKHPVGSKKADYTFNQKWFDVQVGHVVSIKKHSSRTLFLCWPPYADDFALRCLRAYQGEFLISVDECLGGCVADEGYFEELEANWTLVKEIKIPTWRGIEDSMTLYQRN